MRSAGSPERVEEAGSDEVAALASLLTRSPHPATDQAGEDDDGDLAPSVRREKVEPDPRSTLPRQRDEFLCLRCYLIVHVSRRHGEVCRDCW